MFTSRMALAASGDGDGDDTEARRASMLRYQPPENEVAGTVGGAHVLARTDDVAVTLTAVRCYTAGLELELQVSIRAPRTGRARHDELWEAVQQAWVGVELADGTRVLSQGTRFGAEPGSHTLTHSGGGGGGRTFRHAYWLNPAPPAGDVVVVVAVPPLGVPESRHVLAASALAAARAQAVELWPWEPEPAPEVEDALPVVPEGGWFAETLG